MFLNAVAEKNQAFGLIFWFCPFEWKVNQFKLQVKKKSCPAITRGIDIVLQKHYHLLFQEVASIYFTPIR